MKCEDVKCVITSVICAWEPYSEYRMFFSIINSFTADKRNGEDSVCDLTPTISKAKKAKTDAELDTEGMDKTSYSGKPCG